MAPQRRDASTRRASSDTLPRGFRDGLIGFLALLAYAFVGTNSAGIWCFGTDGHVAFEQLGDEHPLVSDSTAIDASAARTVALAAGDTRSVRPHEPCFDVALDGLRARPARDPAVEGEELGDEPGMVQQGRRELSSSSRRLARSLESLGCCWRRWTARAR